MKLKTLSKMVGICLALLITAKNARTQTYVMPGQLTSPFGPGIVLHSHFVGGFSWGSGTISDTVVINPTAYTIEQSGSISLSAASESFQAMDTQMVITDPGFPLPPTTNLVAGTLTMNFDFAGGTFKFDTGTRPLTWNGSSYTFNSETSVDLPMSISYSLVTGGQTYSGTDGSVDLNFPLTLGNQLDIGNYPTSISVSPSFSWVDQWDYSIATVANITAADGFQADILATVPEPSSLAVLGCGLVAFTLIKRRKSF
jgi:hypothetical protein